MSDERSVIAIEVLLYRLYHVLLISCVITATV